MNPRGFTLVELMVVVAIVAILATIAMPLAELNTQRAKEQELRQALRSLRTGIDAYKRAADDGRIPKRIDASGYPPRLEDLVAGVEDAKQANRATLYFLRRIPRDPFHPDPTVPAAATWGKRSYASPADHPQEGADVFDVYSRSEAVGLNGVPYRDW